MKQAEAQQSLAPEQFGSRKAHRAIDQALNKVLTNDLLRQLKLPGAICSNDAKSCYDLIVHTPASLSMQRQGVPESAVVCLFSTLQNLSQQIRTAYGVSDNSYGGSHWILPMHGVGQGNGAGPAIWAVASTPLLAMLRNSEVGSFFKSPISGKEIRFVGYAFVDDTDLIQTAHDHIKTGFEVTGGAIVPEKSHWYLIDFRWTGNEWRYISTAENPASLKVKDIQGNIKQLKRLEAHEAATTLGVDITADGNSDSQYKKMKEASIKWADQIRTGKLKRHEVRLALDSTLWRTLAYPLPCTTLTKKQCDDIMAPALSQALPAMGVCRFFPRNVVHGPLTHMGLDIPHIHTLQEIARIKDTMHHSSIDTFTGQLYRGTLEAMILEVGFGTNIFHLPFLELHHLATQSLVKTTWEFTSEHSLHIKHDIDIPLPGINDTPLMQLFYDKGARGSLLKTLNNCRLYLKAFHLSDITDFSGTFITDSACQGNVSSLQTNDFLWPHQGKPSASAWCIWQTFLNENITYRNRRLRHSLGPWLITGNWKWFYNPRDE